MSLLDGVSDKRYFAVPQGAEFIVADESLEVWERMIVSLDGLAEVISLVDAAVLAIHIDGQRNDFADWVEQVFGEQELADQLRAHPTPLRMMVSIEKFLRRWEANGDRNA